MAKSPKIALALAAATTLLCLAACGPKNTSLPEPEVEVLPSEPYITSEAPQGESTYSPNPWSDEDVNAIALTLAGECYEDKQEDKRLVCEVILNRVSDGGFGGETVLSVVSAPNQFDGYWNQSRPVSENDYAVAEQALEDWHENGCEPLSDYLYFSAGPDRENVFRTDY